MLYKYLFVPAVLGVAGLLFAPDVAFAQRRGGGGGSRGGGHVSAYHGGGGYHGGGYRGGGYYGGRGYGYGWGGYGYFPWWGGYWGRGYWPSYYDGVYAAPNYTYYVEPGTTYADAAPQVPDNSAGIRVIVPDPNAHVWFDGSATTQTGTDRLFNTPSLTAGAHSYRIRATWTQNGREVSQERTVPVMAGRLSVADFTRPPSEALPTPTPGK